MKAKEFFTSVSFRSIIVLVVIAVVLGGALAILNDVLYVSVEEEVNRAIKKIYGMEIGWEEVELNSEYSKNAEMGEINTVYFLEDGNYLMQSVGTNGYKNGTVTLWVVLSFEMGQIQSIEKISYASNTSQSLMSTFDADFYGRYIQNFDGDYFDATDTQYVVGGATRTSRAITNSINMALYYANNALGGQTNEG